MAAGGLLLILSNYVLIWVLRGTLAETGPHALLSLSYGLGGLLLLYLTAGLPLGAILLAAGAARLSSGDRAGRVLLPLLAVVACFFLFDAVRLMLDWNIPLLVFVVSGFLFIVLFAALVWVWARQRPALEPQRRRAADLQLGAGLSFFSAAWQTCGLVGAPAFAMHPEIVTKLGNQSFIAGQALAVTFFFVLGFAFVLLAMWREQA
ncbi:MAG: hypothetical protein KDI03_13705 [Anaerolineae bacterium]|nr:hypothetical protein [Anaerolineae bacterium]